MSKKKDVKISLLSHMPVSRLNINKNTLVMLPFNFWRCVKNFPRLKFLSTVISRRKCEQRQNMYQCKLRKLPYRRYIIAKNKFQHQIYEFVLKTTGMSTSTYPSTDLSISQTVVSIKVHNFITVNTSILFIWVYNLLKNKNKKDFINLYGNLKN